MIPYQPLEMENIDNIFTSTEIDEARYYPSLKTHPLLSGISKRYIGLYPDLSAEMLQYSSFFRRDVSVQQVHANSLDKPMIKK